MIKVGTIGSSQITEQFIQACQLTSLYHVRAAYSRSEANGKDLSEVYQLDYYTTDLNTLLFDPEIDLIYIASPNSIHFDQAMRALRAGKHCIIEKPMFVNVDQWHEAYDLAEKMGVYIFEGIKNIHNRNYLRLKQLVQNKLSEKEHPFLGANLNFAKFSSRYLEYLNADQAGLELPNIFNPEFAGGTLMDLGVYPIYVATDLFGLPETVRYNAVKGSNGIDLYGTIVLVYQEFQVSIFISKSVHSNLTSEIYIDDETIVIHDISEIKRVDLINQEGQEATLISYTPENPLYDELIYFAEMIQADKDIHNQVRYEDNKQLSLQVVQTLQLLAKSAGLNLASSSDQANF
ncbi:Gfo/Idh/MocA family protein [Hutsoniella sourekii]